MLERQTLMIVVYYVQFKQPASGFVALYSARKW